VRYEVAKGNGGTLASDFQSSGVAGPATAVVCSLRVRHVHGIGICETGRKRLRGLLQQAFCISGA
jgi:hypothetical protein